MASSHNLQEQIQALTNLHKEQQTHFEEKKQEYIQNINELKADNKRLNDVIIHLSNKYHFDAEQVINGLDNNENQATRPAQRHLEESIHQFRDCDGDLIEQPMKSTKCGHIYEKQWIEKWIRYKANNRRPTVCPIDGCNVELELDDLVSANNPPKIKMEMVSDQKNNNDNNKQSPKVNEYRSRTRHRRRDRERNQGGDNARSRSEINNININNNKQDEKLNDEEDVAIATQCRTRKRGIMKSREINKRSNEDGEKSRSRSRSRSRHRQRGRNRNRNRNTRSNNNGNNNNDKRPKRNRELIKGRCDNCYNKLVKVLVVNLKQKHNMEYSNGIICDKCNDGITDGFVYHCYIRCHKKGQMVDYCEACYPTLFGSKD